MDDQSLIYWRLKNGNRDSLRSSLKADRKSVWSVIKMCVEKADLKSAQRSFLRAKAATAFNAS